MFSLSTQFYSSFCELCRHKFAFEPGKLDIQWLLCSSNEKMLITEAAEQDYVY